MKNFKDTRGVSILGTLLLCAVLLLVLSYFHISVRSIVESPTGRENVNYVKGEATSFWNTYLRKPARYLWYDIFWKSIHSIERIHKVKSADFDNAVKKLKVSQ